MFATKKIISSLLAASVLLPTMVMAKEQPNVLIIMSDQHKKAESGVYGAKIVKTPNIDFLAKTGVTFNNAYTPAPICAPARAALMTGMYPSTNGAIYHKAPVYNEKKKKEIKVGAGLYRDTGYHEHITTMPNMFRQAGYITAAPGKMHVHGELQKGVDPQHPEGNDMGWDETSVRYYTHFPGGHYEDEVGKDAYHRYRQIGEYKKFGGSQDLNPELEPSLVEHPEDNYDMVVTAKAVEFINHRGKDNKPFFMHVGYEKPHLPLTTLQKYYDMYDYKDFELPETVNQWYEKGKFPWALNWIHNGIPRKSPEKAKRIMAAYAACISEMDDMIGRLIKSLKDNGLYENTMIVYSTDHGEHMFEHGLRGKHNMYDSAINIPFIVSYPKALPQGKFNDSLLSLIDVMPTVAELAGTQLPATVEGVSLVDTMKTGKEIEGRSVYTEFHQTGYKAFKQAKFLPVRMMRHGDYKYVYSHGIIGQLYNVKKDPNELDNLVLNDAYDDLAAQLAFETIADWRFGNGYEPMTLNYKNNQLTWSGFDQAKDFTVFYSATNDPKSATPIAKDLTKKSLKVKDKGYYWVMADFKLKRTTPYYGKKVPVWLAKHTFQFPVSDSLLVN